MRNKISLLNEKTFYSSDEQTILSASEQQGVVLEHSCRNGLCGACKAFVSSGKTKSITSEESLTESEKNSGFILTCCRTALSDIKLEIEELDELIGIEKKTLPCRIDRLRNLSKDVIEVTLRMPPKSHLSYLPGQHLEIIGKNGLRRSYSIANAARDDGKISLHIRKVEGGEMSHYWFNEAKTNDLLRLEGPIGTFFLRKKKTASNLIFLATGTGIAPIKSILEQISKDRTEKIYKNIHLYWGGRTEEDIYWKPNLKNLSLKFTPVLSRSDKWQGKKGYAQQAVITDNLDLDDAVVYACGSEVMINGAYNQLTSKGLNKENFYSDAFVSSK